MSDNYPLVSVIVITYNSENTIVQTLESIESQTYWNIQLIISDDCSQDDTLNVCKRWIKNHQEKFIGGIKLVTSTINTGTPSNCNRAVKASSGLWLKIIAGDDMLLPNCIADNVSFVISNKNIRIAYSNYYCFCTKDGEPQIISECPSDKNNKEFDVCPEKQLYIYLERGFNISPTVFMQRALVEEMGFFIEKYRVFEDTPFYLKVLKNNNRIYYIPHQTVMYRVDAESVTTDASGLFFYKTKFVDCLLQFRKDMVFPLYKWYNFSFWIKEYSFRFQYFFTIIILGNRRTTIKTLFYYLFKLLNPYYLFTAVKKQILR